MTLDDLASYSGEWTTAARTNHHGYDVFTLPPPAQTWATDEILNILDACVPQWAPGQTLASLGPASPKYWHFVVEAKKLAFTDLYAYNADPNVRAGAGRSAALEVARGLAVQPRRPESRVGHGVRRARGGQRRHDRALDRRSLGQHGRLGEQLLHGLRLGPGRARLRHHAAQPRRPVHAGSEESQRHRAAQASVQHAVGRLRHAERSPADDGDADGRRHAGAGDRAGAAQRARPRCEPAGGERHGALPAHAGAERADPRVAALRPRRRAAAERWDTRCKSINGDTVGGYQAIMFTPDDAAVRQTEAGPIKGFYRAGSDHRKDGAAVGY